MEVLVSKFVRLVVLSMASMMMSKIFLSLFLVIWSYEKNGFQLVLDGGGTTGWRNHGVVPSGWDPVKQLENLKYVLPPGATLEQYLYPESK